MTWEWLCGSNFLPNHNAHKNFEKIHEYFFIFLTSFLRLNTYFEICQLSILIFFLFWVVIASFFSDADYLRSANFLFLCNFVFWEVNCFMISDAYYLLSKNFTSSNLGHDSFFMCIQFNLVKRNIWFNEDIFKCKYVNIFYFQLCLFALSHQIFIFYLPHNPIVKWTTYPVSNTQAQNLPMLHGLKVGLSSVGRPTLSFWVCIFGQYFF